MTTKRDLSKFSILIIDQNNHMLSIVKVLLKGLGVRNIHVAKDAADAFVTLQNIQIDILIIDHMQATFDGIEFCRLIRKAEDSPNVFLPIIMLTANTERNFILQARDAGVTEFLSKPISAKALYDRIDAIKNNPRPFASSPSFFGPDRRRRDIDGFSGDEQRKQHDHKVSEKPNDTA